MFGFLTGPRGLMDMIANAKRAATELTDIYGADAQRELLLLERKALAKRAITEFFYWKLVREYIRERNNSGHKIEVKKTRKHLRNGSQ